jgi:hypothetical protein
VCRGDAVWSPVVVYGGKALSFVRSSFNSINQ